jgi:hypothetical protein
VAQLGKVFILALLLNLKTKKSVMKTLVFNKDGFDIYFEPVEDCISLSELLPEETPEEIDRIWNENAVFCAKVTAEKAGVELAEDYLAGCIYKCAEDFYIKYKDDYFADMVNTVIEAAKEELPKLIESLQK